MACVELKDVSKIYDSKTKAVKEASLKIEDGEFTVLVGPSGCGKSTLLRMIAGLEDISGGTITIGDAVVNNMPAKDRGIAMVFQNYALYPHMTVYENMAFGLKLRKTPKKEIEARVTEAAEILDLQELLHRKPKQLSGGQRQRVAVGRAIVRKPAVFLFDEPLSNLDAKLRVQMRLEISKLHKKLGTTMIYVTHDQVEAMTMGHRIVVMNKGVIQQYDTPLNVYKKPVNKFVAGFIGSPSMNFIAATLDKTTDPARLVCNETIIPIDANMAQRITETESTNVTIGFRPEHVQIVEKTDDSSCFTAETELVEPMGNELFVHLKMAGVKVTMRCNPETQITSGQKISVRLLKENIHVFNSQNHMAV